MRRAFVLALCVLFAADALLAAASQVTISGRQLKVRRRLSDGSLAAEETYAIRGVNWSPAIVGTTSDPSVRRPRFAGDAATDIPLMAAMRVNTIRTYIAFEATANGLAVLDQLYANGIMVVMTVDDAGDNLAQITSVVTDFKDHPAILMWSIGNEWN